MMKTIASFLLFSATTTSLCQSPYNKLEFNFGFEKITPGNKLPDHWFKWGSGYNLLLDTLEKHSGNASLLIEFKGEKSDNFFGCAAYEIPANYEGKQIELNAYLKLKNVEDGSIGLMLRIDGESGTLEFDNMMKKKIKGTVDWTLYSVKLPYPKKAKTIYIGAILSGKGQLWADDFELLIDNIDIREAKLKRPVEYMAAGDKEFDNGSNITSIILTESKINDLDILGKIWGFLKYYHPAIAGGRYNWDYELFRVMPGILHSPNQIDRNKLLSDWITGLGKIEPGKQKNKNGKKVKFNPDLAFINNSVLGDTLMLQLSAIKSAKRRDDNYYIGLAAGVGNPEFKNENAYSTMKYPDAGFRLLCLYRYWNIIQYYFPYKNLIEEDWNNVLIEFIPKFINASDELEYKLTVLSLIARVHDTHANIWMKDSALGSYKGLNYSALEIAFIENKAVVKGYYDNDLGEKSGIKSGDVINTINNKPVDEMVKERLPFTPASNYPTKLRNIARDLLRTNDTLLTVSYKRGDSTYISKIACLPSEKIDIYKNYKKDTCFKLIGSDIAYLYPGTIQNEYLPKIKPELLKTKGLIIDFRCYPSDFIVFSLSEYLLPQKTKFAKFSKGSITAPGLFTMTDAIKAGKKNKEYYKGKVVIIVNENTQSSAEYHTMAYQTAPRARVIGSATAAADGNVSGFTLPGGIKTMISGIGVYYPDGKETQRIGIVPDVEVKPSLKGIAENRDELLEKAIQIINEN